MDTMGEKIYFLKDEHPVTQALYSVLEHMGEDIEFIDIHFENKNNIVKYCYCTEIDDDVIYEFVKKKIIVYRIKSENILINLGDLRAVCEDVTKEWYNIIEHDKNNWFSSINSIVNGDGNNEWQNHALEKYSDEKSWDIIAGDYYHCFVFDRKNKTTLIENTLDCKGHKIKMIIVDDQIIDINSAATRLIPHLLSGMHEVVTENEFNEFKNYSACIIPCKDIDSFNNILEDKEIINYDDFVIVLLDLYLSDDKDGREVLNFLGAKSIYPTIVVSATNDWALIADIFARGAKGYFPKGSNDFMLLKILMRKALSEYLKVKPYKGAETLIQWGKLEDTVDNIVHVTSTEEDYFIKMKHENITANYDGLEGKDSNIVEALVGDKRLDEYFAKLFGRMVYHRLKKTLENSDLHHLPLTSIGSNFIPFHLIPLSGRDTVGDKIPISHMFNHPKARYDYANSFNGRRLFIIDSFASDTFPDVNQYLSHQLSTFDDLQSEYIEFLKISILSRGCSKHDFTEEYLRQKLVTEQPNIIHLVAKHDNDNLRFSIAEDKFITHESLMELLTVRAPQLIVLHSCEIASRGKNIELVKDLLNVGVGAVLATMWKIFTPINDERFNHNNVFNSAFYHNLFNDRMTIGEAVLAAKQKTAEIDPYSSMVKYSLNNFVLFGDKSIVLR